MTLNMEPRLVREAVDRELAASDSPVVRVEFPLRRVPDPSAWLSARQDAFKVYWSDRRGDFESAGAGAAFSRASATPVGFSSLLKELRSRLDPRYPRLRFYGGAAFNRINPPDNDWAPYMSHQFVIPRYELLRDGTEWCFACNWPREDTTGAILSDLTPVLREEPPTFVLPPLVDRVDLPDKDGWTRAVENALEAIARGHLGKAVLARRAQFRFAEPLSPMSALRRLREQGRENYLFYFQPVHGTAFISVTPELLATCSFGSVESEALAGTRPRGASAATDAELSQDLLHNEKELREHSAVVEGIDDAFAEHCSEFSRDEVARVVRLRDCQHLVRRIRGRLRPDADLGAFLESLHPTPAVGGMPKDAALALIRRLEPFDRGWYAGPIGWVGAGGFEFAVGIRSGRIEDRTATLYAGAGLVAGSDPAREWEEVEMKMQASIHLVRNGD